MLKGKLHISRQKLALLEGHV